MIAKFTTFLQSKTTLTDIVGERISYKKPIKEEKDVNYLYYTSIDYKDATGYKVDITFTLIGNSFKSLELLTEALRVALRDRDKKVPDDLKLALPELRKINERLKFDFDDDLIRVIKYELYLNH